MNELIFSVAGVAYIGWPWFLLAIPLILIIIGGFAYEENEEVGSGFAGTGIVLAFAFSLFYGTLIEPGIREDALEAQQVAAIEELGLENVSEIDYDGEFTASLDGDYFRGKVVQLDVNEYQILELVER